MNKLSEKYIEDKHTILSIIKYLLIIGIALVMLFFGGKLLWLLFPVLIGFVIAYVSNKISKTLYRLFRRKQPKLNSKGRDTKGYKFLKLIIYFIIFLTFIGFLVLIIFVLISQLRNLMAFLEKNAGSFNIAEQISNFISNFSARLGDFLPQSTIQRITEELIKLQDNIISQIPNATAKVLPGLIAIVGTFPDFLFKVIVIVMSGYYFISDRVFITKFINSILPSKTFVDKVTETVKKVSTSLFRIIGGYSVIMIVTFFEALIGLIILRIPYAVVIAVAVMFIDLLPMVGASAFFVPISIYMFVQGEPLQGIIALIIVAIMTIVRSALQPIVIGDAIKLHPLATLASMLLGMSLLGFIGFLAGPIIMIFLIGIVEAFSLNNLFKNWSTKILNKIAKSDYEEDETFNKIRHIVMWRIKDNFDGYNKKELSKEICNRILELPSMIPEIMSLECKTDLETDNTAFDLILIADFKDKKSMEVYVNHPEHKKVANFITESTLERSAMDIYI